MTEACVLMRPSLAEEAEFDVSLAWLPTYRLRSEVPADSLVVARYSALPYYQELEEDLAANGSRLINSFRQHRYVADIQNWYYDFEHLTPKTWFRVSDVPEDAKGSFVLKGATNSRKHLWRTHMFAPTREDVPVVMSRLLDDPLISEQGIYVREYVPFMALGTSVNGMPVTNEWRVFVLNGEVISSGFYWSSHPEVWTHQLSEKVRYKQLAEDFVRGAVAFWVNTQIPFVVVDVAFTPDDTPWIVELNDGQMSGLSECDPEELYSALGQL